MGNTKYKIFAIILKNREASMKIEAFILVLLGHLYHNKHM